MDWFSLLIQVVRLVFTVRVLYSLGLLLIARHRWQPVSGLILSSQLRTVPGRTPTVANDVRYIYAVAGRVYRSSAVSLFDVSTNFASVYLAVQRRYPAGGRVTLYCDPAWPQRSALELRLGRGTGLFVLVLGALWLLGPRGWR